MARIFSFSNSFSRIGAGIFVIGLSVSALVSCKTRVFGQGQLRSTEGQEGFIHWAPGKSKNRTWAEEKADRQKRWAKLHSPLRGQGSGLGGFEAVKNQVVNCVGLVCDSDYRDAVWGFNWFRDTPVGFTGFPLVLFRAMVEDAQDPSSPFHSIWGDLGWYGLVPHPRDFDKNGFFVARGAGRPLPMGMGWTRPPDEKSPSFESIPQMTKDQVARFARSKVQRAFISCGSCHTGRVAIPTDGGKHRFEFLYGAPTTEYDQTAFGQAAAKSLEVIRQSIQSGTPEQIAQNRENLKKRLLAAIERLKVREKHFPYGNNLEEVYWNGTWQKNVPDIWRALEVGVVTQKMDAIFDAMVANLDTRNQIVEGLRNSAYKGPGKPDFDGDSPGSLDAFGFGGAIVGLTRAGKQAKGIGGTSYNSPEQRDVHLNERIAAYYDALVDAPASSVIIPQHAAKVDPASIWGERPDLRAHANWDGNQRSAGARALSTSLAITASPAFVDVEGSSFVQHYMSYNPGGRDLPTYPSASAIYPFKVDEELASVGKDLFERHCYSCHHPQNERVYPIDPAIVPNDQLAQINSKYKPAEGWIGTDPYRAIQITDPVRAGLLALWNETCQHRGWCNSADEKNRDIEDPETREKLRWDRDVFRARGDEYEGVPQLTGYVASPLDGVWARAPYLHNGSVPHIRALIVPRLRDTTVDCGGQSQKGFWRGNILYNENDLGFVHSEPPFTSCNPRWKEQGQSSPFEGSDAEPVYDTASKSARIFNYSLEGNSNRGHDTEGFLGGVDWERETVQLGTRVKSKADALIEYMKTL